MADTHTSTSGESPNRIYRWNDSGAWIVNHHRENLVRLVSSRSPQGTWARIRLGRDPNEGLGGRMGFRVDFAELQRMKMRKLQIRLISHAARMARTGQEPVKPSQQSRETGDESDEDKENNSVVTTWEEDLKEYVKAVRDYEFMAGFAGEVDDPFKASSEHRVDHKILEEEMHKAGIDFSFLAQGIHSKDPDSPSNPLIFPTGPWNVNDSPIWGRRHLKDSETRKMRMWRRLGALVVVQFTVQVPVVGIVLATLIPGSKDTLAARLAPFVVAFLSVFFWANYVIWVVKRMKDVVALTAGYAALLLLVVNGAASIRPAVYPVTSVNGTAVSS
ncbi:hypothetical protein V8F06_014842 [Rhypophila decipiens]